MRENKSESDNIKIDWGTHMQFILHHGKHNSETLKRKILSIRSYIQHVNLKTSYQNCILALK